MFAPLFAAILSTFSWWFWTQNSLKVTKALTSEPSDRTVYHVIHSIEERVEGSGLCGWAIVWSHRLKIQEGNLEIIPQNYKKSVNFVQDYGDRRKSNQRYQPQSAEWQCHQHNETTNSPNSDAIASKIKGYGFLRLWIQTWKMFGKMQFWYFSEGLNALIYTNTRK